MTGKGRSRVGELIRANEGAGHISGIEDMSEHRWTADRVG